MPAKPSRPCNSMRLRPQRPEHFSLPIARQQNLLGSDLMVRGAAQSDAAAHHHESQATNNGLIPASIGRRNDGVRRTEFDQGAHRMQPPPYSAEMDMLQKLKPRRAKDRRVLQLLDGFPAADALEHGQRRRPIPSPARISCR